jgi:UDP-glucose 4-epimerase
MNINFKKLKNKKVLITGGLGFIGSNLAHRLVAEGAQVELYDAQLDPYGWNYTNIREIEKNVSVVKADIRDKEKLLKHVAGKEIIFHLAAQVGREISMADPALDTEINCNGTINLCQVMVELNSKAKIVYAGSRGQIGEPVYLPVDEQHPTNPTDVYGINKLAAEKYLLLYGHIYNFPVVSLRLNNVYGPRCQMHHGFYGILNWFITNVHLGKPITVYGDGQQTRDYVFVEDVVDAFVRAALCESIINDLFFIGSGVETLFLDMVKNVINCMGKGEYKHIPFPPERENIDIRKFVISFEKFKQATGWGPKFDLNSGINKTIDFYQSRWSNYLDGSLGNE